MKGKAAKLKLQRRQADYGTMIATNKGSYAGYKCPGSVKKP